MYQLLAMKRQCATERNNISTVANIVVLLSKTTMFATVEIALSNEYIRVHTMHYHYRHEFQFTYLLTIIPLSYE